MRSYVRSLLIFLVALVFSSWSGSLEASRSRAPLAIGTLPVAITAQALQPAAVLASVVPRVWFPRRQTFRMATSLPHSDTSTTHASPR
jgi:hypothetical protein